MDWFAAVAFVVLLVHLWLLQYEVRILRAQMNKLAGPPSDQDTTLALRGLGAVDQPPVKNA